MPFTPYHFGPSGFVGLAFRKYIDLPVFLLANIIVDIEVLVINVLGSRWPMHRYAHTLLLGAVAGVIWGFAAYPLRHLFKKTMQKIGLPYQTNLRKMVISGVLGVWLHVVIDALYHYDVRLFWPSRARPLWQLLTQAQVKAVCVAFFIAAAILYAIIAAGQAKQRSTEPATKQPD